MGAPGESVPGASTPGTFAYNAALDGLRALAVLSVIAYHDDYSWAKGGFLGVDTFFALSGFLITTLLVIEFRARRTIRLRRFWARRSRRLLPALLLALVLVAVYTRVAVEPWNRTAIRADAFASLAYIANWHFIAARQGYFQLFSAQSPLRHMWSLAIEEQFYLVWPLVVYAVLRASRGSMRALAAVCAAGLAASVAVIAVTYRPGDASRAYYGTDARAHTILAGALLAVVLACWKPTVAARRRVSAAGVVAFATMVVAWVVATGTSARYYRGGSALYGALVCVVIAAASQPGVLHRALASRPLAWIGRLSYGLYLFHWPLVVWLVPSRVHLHGDALNALRLGATFGAAIVSYYFVESPIRGRAPFAQWRATRAAGPARRARPRHAFRWLALPAVGTTAMIVVASSAGASTPPSYLSGTTTPAFTFPVRVGTSAPGPARGTRTAAVKHNRAGRPTRSRDAPRPPNVTLTVPNIDFHWSFGDPLFCGPPRPNETRDAVDEARALGPPRLPHPAANLRILVLGDSTACSLFPGLKAVGDEVGAGVAQAAVFGCGIASGEITTTRGEQITPHSERCPVMVDAAELPAVATMRPDVVVWMSVWEKSDMIAGGRTLVSGTPAGDAEIQRRMDAALARITSYGARVVLLTVAAPAPNDAEGASNTSNAVDDAGYARLDRIDRRFAARHPATVTLVDLARRLCPAGPPCPERIDGRRMRPDGRHFTPAAATIEARWLMPWIVSAAGA